MCVYTADFEHKFSSNKVSIPPDSGSHVLMLQTVSLPGHHSLGLAGLRPGPGWERNHQSVQEFYSEVLQQSQAES